MRYVLKEMTIGEVLDVGVNIAKDNFKPLFMITLYILLPMNLVSQILLLSVIPDPPGMFAPMAEQQAYQQTLIKNLMDNVPLFAVLIFASMVVTPITYAAIIRSIAGTYLGQPISPGQAIKAGLAVAVPYAFIHITIAMLVSLTIVSGMIPGIAIQNPILAILGFFFAIVPALYLATRLYLAPYCLIVEGAGIGSAFSRSWALMKGNIGNGFVLGMIVTMAVAMTNGMAGMIPQRHIAGVLGALIACATVLGSCATSVVFYFSCRCKHENFDLSVLASAVGQEAPPSEMGDSGGPTSPGGPSGLSGPSAPAQG